VLKETQPVICTFFITPTRVGVKYMHICIHVTLKYFFLEYLYLYFETSKRKYLYLYLKLYS